VIFDFRLNSKELCHAAQIENLKSQMVLAGGQAWRSGGFHKPASTVRFRGPLPERH